MFRIRTEFFAVIMILICLPCQPSKSLTAAEPSRWEKSIRAFEQQDRKMPPAQGALLFVGSSSIRMWDLTKSFPDLKTINRGFGGSQMSDVLEFYDRIVKPYRPAVIVLYEGDNDIAAGESAELVAAEYRRLIGRIHADLPKARVVFVSIKPSLKRWDIYPAMKSANDKIRAIAEQDARLEFVDVSEVMLGPDGKPIASLFLKDGLHLNEEGNRRWSKLVRPLLGSDSR